ncbi:uncharacterized protein LOC116988012 isoform X1 [Amblyraja radiata]|uniref:uncharacterized protein LOC116988012 isoform X1 n=1 Tax=Amblyraja radiata TaxID=386614 RepID=UPI0014037E6D|nr:uncharacterized protein LOC116988012 isoform X1 [Amblyraja radiata]
MSRKEPLLGALKACILNIQADNDPITDGHPHLTSLCDILEIILRKGIRQPVLGLWRRDYWHWMEQLPQQDTCSRLTQLSMALEKTLACKRTRTAQGRGRYYIRQAMNQKIMAVTIHHLLHTPRLLEWYDRESSVLTNECFAEPFLSLLLVLSQMKFTLDLENSSFLDESWLLPVCEMYNTVPCRELGMVLWYTGGRIFVTEVIAGSQAEADECVQAGDIIDEINGVALRNAKGGEAQTVLQKLRGKPLSFRMIHWKWHDGSVYRPMLPHLQLMQKEFPDFQLRYDTKSNKEMSEDRLQDDRLLYSLRYLGQVNIGMYGGKEVLDEGIEKVLQQNLVPQEVLLDVKETEVISMENSTQVLFHHHYPEIASVGQRLDRQALFAYCVAVSPETPQTTSFDCLVFESNSVKDATEIVSRIAAGFRNTEWFV